MSTKPKLRTGPDPEVTAGLLERRAAVKKLLGSDTDDLLFVSGLAGAKDDVLAAVGDSPNAYTLSGAMGAATAMGLGLALAQPSKRVIVVTGEGELLMNLGTLATAAVLDPPNFSVVCVDNMHYGETGWQESHTARGVDLAKMAEGAGIPHVRTVTKDSELEDAGRLLRESNAMSFVLLKVAPTDASKVFRSRDASWIKGRFREALLGEN
jgi:phosphonopyruvate decarboxylase